jgi:hypothetical protein
VKSVLEMWYLSHLFLNSTNVININSLEIKFCSLFCDILRCFVLRADFWEKFEQFGMIPTVCNLSYQKELYVVETVVCICM